MEKGIGMMGERGKFMENGKAKERGSVSLLMTNSPPAMNP